MSQANAFSGDTVKHDPKKEHKKITIRLSVFLVLMFIFFAGIFIIHIEYNLKNFNLK